MRVSYGTRKMIISISNLVHFILFMVHIKFYKSKGVLTPTLFVVYVCVCVYIYIKFFYISSIIESLNLKILCMHKCVRAKQVNSDLKKYIYINDIMVFSTNLNLLFFCFCFFNFINKSFPLSLIYIYIYINR